MPDVLGDTLAALVARVEQLEKRDPHAPPGARGRPDPRPGPRRLARRRLRHMTLPRLSMLPTLPARDAGKAAVPPRTRTRPGDGRQRPGRSLPRRRAHRRRHGRALPLPDRAHQPGCSRPRHRAGPGVRPGHPAGANRRAEPGHPLHRGRHVRRNAERSAGPRRRPGPRQRRVPQAGHDAARGVPRRTASTGSISTLAFHHLPSPGPPGKNPAGSRARAAPRRGPVPHRLRPPQVPAVRALFLLHERRPPTAFVFAGLRTVPAGGLHQGGVRGPGDPLFAAVGAVPDDVPDSLSWWC
jgi:hypothetical protein